MTGTGERASEREREREREREKEKGGGGKEDGGETPFNTIRMRAMTH